jgi:hypothetical protein
MLNDDFTPMEFVMSGIAEYFRHDIETATQIMLKIHHEGRGVCGVLPKMSRPPRSNSFLPPPARRASPAVHSGDRMIAQELEVSLHMAFVEARQQRHEFITVEHLLLALIDNPSASEVLKACAANLDELRKTWTSLCVTTRRSGWHR